MTTFITRPLRVLSFLGAIAPAMLQVGCDETAPVADESLVELDSESRAAQSGPYAGYSLYAAPDGNADEQADLWRASRPADAAVMDKVAANPVAIWVGDWTYDVTDEVDDALDAAGPDRLLTFVVYNIPDRDCGAWSSGGASSGAEYETFVDQVGAGLEGRMAIVVLEPDGLALMDCLDSAGQAERKALMSEAVDELTENGAAVYIDAGDSNWISASEISEDLLDAGVDRAAGFALNVSHTEYTADENGYAQEIRAIVGTNAHYVIDTSRNGLGPSWDNEWCNPLGRAHGRAPTLRTSAAGLDALLWIKPPGESDGSCNGGPEAGDWWAEYALDLAQNAGY